MPGVPSGRGCDACRKQKKKCDQLKPACSRCSRLQIPCVGSGTQRYKFKEDSRSGTGTSFDQNGPSLCKFQREDTSQMALQIPSNETTLLANALIVKLKAFDDLRYHLTWCYGGFIEDIPRHLGTNEALDTAVAALVASHTDLGSRPKGALASFESLTRYSRALGTLRLYLDDHSRAREVETLCAVMLLLICQSFLGHVGQWSTHGQGAAQILKARAYYDPNDEFETKLVLSLRGPVLFEALVNPKICFTPDEWSKLVENHLDGESLEGAVMRCLARAPNIIQRGRTAFKEQTVTDVEALKLEIASHYATLKTTLHHMHARLRLIPNVPGTDSKQSALSLTTLHALYQRSYGLGLAICIIFNCIFKALDPNNAELEADATNYCQEVLDLAEQAAKYRPLGASFVFLCLVVAWCDNADNLQLQAKVQATLLDYRADFAGPEVGNLEADLAYAHRRLSLREA